MSQLPLPLEEGSIFLGSETGARALRIWANLCGALPYMQVSPCCMFVSTVRSPVITLSSDLA